MNGTETSCSVGTEQDSEQKHLDWEQNLSRSETEHIEMEQNLFTSETGRNGTNPKQVEMEQILFQLRTAKRLFLNPWLESIFKLFLSLPLPAAYSIKWN